MHLYADEIYRSDCPRCLDSRNYQDFAEETGAFFVRLETRNVPRKFQDVVQVIPSTQFFAGLMYVFHA